MDRSRRIVGTMVAGLIAILSLSDPEKSVAAGFDDPFVAMRVSPIPPGSPAPVFDLKALEGGSMRSRDLAGTVVLLNFWATWCGPCKDEMPSLARLQQQFDYAHVRVVTVTSDIHPQGIKQFLGHLGIQLPVLFDEDQELSRVFMVRGLPTTVLLGSDGGPVGRAVGPREWDSNESIVLLRRILQGVK